MSKVAVSRQSQSFVFSSTSSTAALKVVLTSDSVTGILFRKCILSLMLRAMAFADLPLGCRATTGLDNQGGIGHNGGVWEWTSTVFDKHDGFATSKLYPG